MINFPLWGRFWKHMCKKEQNHIWPFHFKEYHVSFNAEQKVEICSGTTKQNKIKTKVVQSHLWCQCRKAECYLAGLYIFLIWTNKAILNQNTKMTIHKGCQEDIFFSEQTQERFVQWLLNLFPLSQRPKIDQPIDFLHDFILASPCVQISIWHMLISIVSGT